MTLLLLLACDHNAYPLESALWRSEGPTAELMLSSEPLVCTDFVIGESTAALPGDKVGFWFTSFDTSFEGDYYLGLSGGGASDQNGGAFERSFSAWIDEEGEEELGSTRGKATLTDVGMDEVVGSAATDLFDVSFRAQNCDSVDNRCESAEVCDGLDNDCDSEVDEGVKETLYLDEDGDGYGSGAAEVRCPGAGLVDNDADCNDGDPDQSPGSAERCDGDDNDCDASIDEGAC